jgi:hypothetical protein
MNKETMVMLKKVKVIAVYTDEVLLEVPMEQMAVAYEYAAQMDEMGIEVKVVAPTIADTLSSSLGLTVDDHEKLQTSIEEEIEDHDGSCCATPHYFGDQTIDKSKLQ